MVVEDRGTGWHLEQSCERGNLRGRSHQRVDLSVPLEGKPGAPSASCSACLDSRDKTSHRSEKEGRGGGLTGEKGEGKIAGEKGERRGGGDSGGEGGGEIAGEKGRRERNGGKRGSIERHHNTQQIL